MMKVKLIKAGISASTYLINGYTVKANYRGEVIEKSAGLSVPSTLIRQALFNFWGQF